MLNAPGKAVQFIIEALKTHMNDESYKKLMELQSISLTFLKFLIIKMFFFSI
jgi:hypothetical protein